MSSVILRQRKIAGEPGLARRRLGDDQRQALALPKDHLRLDIGGDAVRHGDEDEHLRAPDSAASQPSSFCRFGLAVQSAPQRNATAAATGPMTENNSDSAARIRKGGRNGSGSATARIARRHAEDQHRDHQRQHQHRDHQPAARQRDRDRRADRADEGDGRRADQQGQRRGADARGLDVHEQAEQRRGHDQRQHARRPVRQAFDQHRERQHVPVGRRGSADRASRPRGRPGTAGRDRAGWPAARRSTGSPGRCGRAG